MQRVTFDAKQSNSFIFLIFPDRACDLRTVRSTRMNKSALVALCVGFLAVLSCLGPVVHGKPAPSTWCCRLGVAICCERRLKASPISAQVKRKEQAMAVRVHDAKADVKHAGVRLIEDSYSRA